MAEASDDEQEVEKGNRSEKLIDDQRWLEGDNSDDSSIESVAHESPRIVRKTNRPPSHPHHSSL